MKRLFILFILSFGFLFTMAPRVFAYDFEVGNDAIDRPSVDSYRDFVIVDTNQPSQKEGFITEFHYFARNTNTFKFIIVTDAGKVTWKSDLIIPDDIGENSYIPSSPADIKVGGNIGMYFQDTGTIPFTYDLSANLAYYSPNNNGEPTIGDFISVEGTTGRFYSFVANGFERKAEITFPMETNDVVLGPLPSFSAFLIDSKENSAYFAIRKGSCTGTDVWANVGGKTDDYDWEADSLIPYRYDFLTQPDVSSWEDGKYCFVFRARRFGIEDIRLTRIFYLDSDGDGLIGNADLCPNTRPDEPSEGLGVNRHIWTGSYFETLVPAGKGTFNPIESLFTITGTHGCSCEQILDRLVLATGESFGGHYKFGCSKSIIEDWIDGKYYMETITVPSDVPEGATGEVTLKEGQTYLLKAYGVADAGDTIDFDAKYSITKRIAGDTWTDEVSGYTSYGTRLLDLFVNGVNIDWGTYNEEHIYWYELEGNGLPLSLHIYDVHYPNNIGDLFVDLYVKLY